MGKGLALAFKDRFPAMFRDYRERCERGEVRVGQPYLYKPNAPGDPWVLNFPTKDDWRRPSRLPWIRAGLEHFAEHYREWGVTSIAFPQLGTLNGKLSWDEVRPLMHELLDSLDLDVRVYTVQGSADGAATEPGAEAAAQPRLL